jgi:hypothetical protein
MEGILMYTKKIKPDIVIYIYDVIFVTIFFYSTANIDDFEKASSIIFGTFVAYSFLVKVKINEVIRESKKNKDEVEK